MILSVANSRPRNMQSIQVRDTLPEPVANNSNIDSFAQFLEDYYRYMNLDNSPSREIASITQNKDIDLATEKYLDEIELLIAKYIPRSKRINRERLLKIINNYYKIRGTEEGTKLFFKLFFDDDVDIFYPRDRMLNPSDGSGKYKNFSLKTVTLEDGSTLDVKNILEQYDNEDLRVYGQYEYNENLKLYENIGRRVPTEYSLIKEVNTRYGLEENEYLGTNTAISGNGKIIAIADKKGAINVYKISGGSSQKLGGTIFGQSPLSVNITFNDSTDEIFLDNHNLSSGDEISFVQLQNVIGLDEKRIYYVLKVDSDKFKISKTPGAKPIVFSTSGTSSAILLAHRKFGYAMAFNFDGTKLLISEPGYTGTTFLTVPGSELLALNENFELDLLEEDEEDIPKELDGIVSSTNDPDSYVYVELENSVYDHIEENDADIPKELEGNLLIEKQFYSGRVLLYEFDSKTQNWKIAKKGDGYSSDAVFYGDTRLGDDIAVFGHSVALNNSGDSIAISSTKHFGGEHLDYVLSYKYKNNPEIWESIEFNDNLNAIILNDHSFSDGDKVFFRNIVGTSGLGERKTYYVIQSSLNSFKISLRPNSTPVDFSGNGIGEIYNAKRSWQPHGLFPINTATLREVSLDDETSILTMTNHGLSDGDEIIFYDLFNVDGINVHQIYYVVQKTTDTFKISPIVDGPVLEFENSGSAKILPPSFKIGKITHTLNGEDFGWSLAFSSNGSRLAIGIPGASLKTSSRCGRIDVYDYGVTGNWNLADNTSLYGTKFSGERYGHSLSLSANGNILVGGAPYRAGVRTAGQKNVGCVVSHIWKGQYWTSLGKTPLYGNYVEGLFGYKVALSGDGLRLALSAPGREIAFGEADINTYSYIHVYEYDFSKDAWNQSWDTLEKKSYDLYLGYSLGMSSDGNKLLCSTPYNVNENYALKSVNGENILFTRSNNLNDKPTYVNGTQSIFYNGTQWAWTNGEITYISYPGDEDSPWLASWPISLAIPLNINGEVDFFTFDNFINGKASFISDTLTIFYDGTKWKVVNIASETDVYVANAGSEQFPWLATWSVPFLYELWMTPVNPYKPQSGSVDFYNISKVNRSFSSDRTTKISKKQETVNGVQREVWSIYDIFSESLTDKYGYSYITSPFGGSNPNYMYSTLEYTDIPDDGHYTASTTETIVTEYYKEKDITLNGDYTIKGNILYVVAKNHRYKFGDKVYFNFTTGDLVGKNNIFTVSEVGTSLDLNDTIICYNTNLYYNATQNGEVTFLAPSPLHPYEVKEWAPITTPEFDYSDTIKITAAPDDIRWIHSNNKGFLSDKYKLQDSHYWQTHSYEIRTHLQAAEWKDQYMGFCHPMGYELFSIFEIIEFAENDWVEYIKYFSADQRNASYIPPRIRDIIKYPTLLPEGMAELLGGRGQHTPRSQPGRGLDRDLILIIFGKMFNDLGKTYTLKTESNQGNYVYDSTHDWGSTLKFKTDYPNQIVYTRNMVRMLYAYLQLYIDSKYIRGQDAKYLKFLGDDIDSIDNIEYKKSGAVQAYIYNTTEKLWETYGQKLFGDFANDMFGSSVSINSAGTRIAISIPGNDNTTSSQLQNVGCVKIYEYNSSSKQWDQLGNTIIGKNASDFFGSSLELNDDGSIIAIGCPQTSTAPGYIQIYEYLNEIWIQRGQDIIGNSNDDLFGSNISISDTGNRVAIGAPQNISNPGYVKVYDYNSTTKVWDQIGSTLSGGANGDSFGFSLQLNNSGSHLIVGSPLTGATDAGSVRVYSYSGGAWSQLGTNITGSVAGDKFGTAVTINETGDRIAVGIPYSDFIGEPSNRPNRGLIRAYKFELGEWTQLGHDIEGDLYDSNGGYDIAFSLDGSKLLVGAPNHFGGYAKVYELSENPNSSYPWPRWTQVGNDVYGSIEYYEFGKSVAINSTGNIILVGENGGNERVKKNDGQSLENGLLHLTPDEYMSMPTATTASRILNFPTNITTSVRPLTVNSVPTVTAVNEGGSVTFNITTEGVRHGSYLYYTTTSQSDIVNAVGDFQILNDSGAFSINIANDSLNDPLEQFVVAIRTRSTSGPIIHWTRPIIIN